MLDWLFGPEKGKSQGGWSGPTRIPLSKIDYYQSGGGSLFGHGPDERRENKGLLRNEGPPIHVTRRGGRYRIHDGNDRVHYARQAGRSTIAAYIKD